MRLIKANESSAAKRRVYFHVIESDGINPATDEAGEQPQASVDGGAWTDAGIGVLVAIGEGRYYAELDQATVATAGTWIETRYKGETTAESPGDSVQVVAFDPASLADVETTNTIVHGQPVIHVAHDGNDATSGASLKAAIEAADAGTLVLVSEGVFALGTDAIVIPAGVSVSGRSPAATRITSTREWANGAILVPGTGSRIADLFVHGTTTDTQVPIGYDNAGQPAFDFAILDNVHTLADQDGVFLPFVGDAAQRTLIMRRCHLRSGYDCFVTGFGDDWRIIIEDCYFEAQGPSAASGSEGISAALFLGCNGNVVVRRSRLLATNSAGTLVRGLVVFSLSNADVDLVETAIYTAAPSGTVRDIDFEGGGSVRVARSSYDPSKTAGTITQIDTPGNVTGKVLGGGDATIGGVGARVVKGDGTEFIESPWSTEQRDEVLAQLDTIETRTAVGVSVSPGSHIADDGQTLELIQGETYLADINNALRIEVTDPRLPAELGDTVPILHVGPRGRAGSTLTVEGTVAEYDAETGHAICQFELTQEQSAGLTAGQANAWELDWLIEGDEAQVITSIIDAPCHVRRQIA